MKYNDKIKVDRKFYQSFLSYLKDNNITIVSTIEKQDLTQTLIKEFHKEDEYLRYVNEHQKVLTRKTKFNASLFMKYGYENREIGITMKAFKAYIENGLHVKFDDWLDDNDSIERYIDYYQMH